MQLEEFQYIGALLSLKVVTVLQAVYNGQREVHASIFECPIEQEVTESMEIIDKVKDQVKEVTQQYEDFKIKISDYTISS